MHADTSDKLLFTPGPLTTSATVKQAMLHDLGSRDQKFIQMLGDIRNDLLRIAGVDASTHAAIPMQGSGTFALEAVAASVIPRNGKLLVGVNGAYGQRMVTIAERLGIPTVTCIAPESEALSADALERMIVADAAITHIAVCHCETTSGVINDLAAISAVAAQHGRILIVDAMSSFGAVPVDVGALRLGFLVSSANKCIEGVPGFAFVIAHLETLLKTRGTARSVSLDLLAQYEALEKNGQFRFTPPTHAFLAFAQALQELEAEGGVQGRGARYAENHRVLCEGMKEMGFHFYLPEPLRSPIITSFHYPKHPNFDFEHFYESLSEQGCLIYPGKVGDANCFRIGSIGRLYPKDMTRLLEAIKLAITQMQIPLPLT